MRNVCIFCACFLIVAGGIAWNHAATAGAIPQEDTSCPGGYSRPLDAKETAYFAKFDIARSALPRVSGGWKLQIEPKSAPTKMCLLGGAGEPSTLASDYDIGLAATYRRPLTPAEQKQSVNLDGEISGVGGGIPSMARLVEQIMQQKVSTAPDSIKPELLKQYWALHRDRKATVRIDVISIMSGGFELPTCYGKPTTLSVAGAQAYECYNYGSDAPIVTPQIIVLFGQFAPQIGKGSYLDANRKQVQGEEMTFKPSYGDFTDTHVQYVVVVIEADNRARAEALFESTDFRKLGGLMD